MIATIEFFKSASARYSDIILPAAANHEYEDLSPRAGHINTRPKIVEPPGECRSDIQWVNMLARSMDLGDGFWATEEEVYDYVLEPIGKTYRELVEQRTLWAPQSYQKYMANGFRTPSGKVEIYSESLQKMGINPLPMIFPQITNTQDFPLVLTNGKDPYSYHSSWRRLPSLRKISNEPLVELNPLTAKKKGLKEGDMVKIEMKRGSITQRVRYNSDLDPRIVYAAFGWGCSDENGRDWRKANINILTDWDTRLCEAMGATTLRGIPCKISRVSN